jgi:hypothetical protein
LENNWHFKNEIAKADEKEGEYLYAENYRGNEMMRKFTFFESKEYKVLDCVTAKYGCFVKVLTKSGEKRMYICCGLD